tara:strand:+ start:3513 stop:3674 length:162 start_codon:yes stop_codon:yes gene_type:complete
MLYTRLRHPGISLLSHNITVLFPALNLLHFDSIVRCLDWEKLVNHEPELLGQV